MRRGQWHGGVGSLGICAALRREPRKVFVDCEVVQGRREVTPCQCGGTVVLEFRQEWHCRRCGRTRA